MSALKALKELIPLQNDEVETSYASNLKNLKEFVNFHTSQEVQIPQLLEQIRIEALEEEHSNSSIELLSGEVLNKMTNKFVSYRSNIKVQIEKLQPVRTIISNFENDLEKLSSNLISLREQSTKLTLNLSSQRAAIEKLNPVILDLMIPPDIVNSLLKDRIDEKWVENIRFINEKLSIISNVKSNDDNYNLNNGYKDSLAFKELESGINVLIEKAVERIRDFMILQIKKLRSSSKASSQNIQQDLIRVREVYIFLKTHHLDLANQLQLAYIYTMKWYYYTRFAKYLYAIEKLHIYHIDANLTLGNDINEEKSGLFGIKTWLYSGNNSLSPASASSPNQQHQITMSDYLSSIDKRVQILEENYSSERKSAIPSQIAETTPFSYWLEFIYNQWSIALIDNIVVEYLFMIEFFYQGDEKFSNIDLLTGEIAGEYSKKDWSQVMFEGVFKLGTQFVSWLLSNNPTQYARGTAAAHSSRLVPSTNLMGSCDAYATLLMIRLVQKSQSSLHNEFHIPVLDDYLNSILLILWPHFTKIIDLNCESMKKLLYHTPNEATFAPITLTQQFGQFLSGLLKLVNSKDKDKDYKGEPLFTSVTRLKNDYEVILNKMSKNLFGSGQSKSTEKEIFLYNNYFLIVNILKNENDSDSNLFINEQIKHFEILCEAYRKN